jgi:HAD superfamily hydrolase (TIGR01450 family)
MSNSRNLISRMPSRFKAALIDLSGTIHVGHQAMEGAIEACQKLNRSGVQVKFLTNTTTVSSSILLTQLRSIGFDETAIPSQDSIMTSAVAAREFLNRNNLKPFFLVDENLLEDLRIDNTNSYDPNCVLVGLSPTSFQYQKLNDAFRLLFRLKKEQELEEKQRTTDSSSTVEVPPLLIAIHRAKYFKDVDKELSLGPGGFVSLLEEAVGITAHVVGKPSVAMFQSAIQSMGVDAKDTVMVGDDVVSDIGGALNAGLGAAILVRTGKYLKGDELKLDALQPTLVVDSFVEAVEYIVSA